MAGNGIECLVPDDGSHRFLVDSIDRLADEGAEGAILGCTELGLILDEDDGVVPGFNTTRIHSIAAVDASLA